MSDGPSTSANGVYSQAADHAATGPASTVRPGKAPYRHLPLATFGSVEYPGPVSHPSALLKVVTQDDLNEVFNAPAAATHNANSSSTHKDSNKATILEMRYRMDDKNGVPVKGNRAPSQKLLLRITRRRRKGMDDSEDDAMAGGEARRANDRRRGKGKDSKELDKGVFVADILGPINYTVRFRQMADFHYTPPADSRISQLVESLKSLDYDAILDYSVAPLSEDFVEPIPHVEGEPPPDPAFRSLTDLQPPPVFISTRAVPPVWQYRNSSGTLIEEHEDPQTGETRMRHVNKARSMIFAPQRIGHGHPKGSVPKEPPKGLSDRMKKLNQPLFRKLQNVFQQRPVWLRYALYQNFTLAEQKILSDNKVYLAATCYVIGAGPYWKCMARLGYDPCYDPAAHIYQRIYFYLDVNRSSGMILRATSVDSDGDDEDEDEDQRKDRGWWEAEQQKLVAAGERQPLDPTKGHIFDGETINRDKPDYQLNDITDPLVRKYIDNPNNLKDVCDAKDGWYIPAAMTAIKNITRIKYAYLREHGKPAPNSACYEEIERYEREIRMTE